MIAAWPCAEGTRTGDRPVDARHATVTLTDDQLRTTATQADLHLVQHISYSLIADGGNGCAAGFWDIQSALAGVAMGERYPGSAPNALVDVHVRRRLIGAPT